MKTAEFTGNTIITYVISHEQFLDCASICDICSVVASGFRRQVNAYTQRNEENLFIEIALRRNGGMVTLDFTDKSVWNMVQWLIYKDDGRPEIRCPILRFHDRA